jgi:hypothetical protein
MSSHDRPWQPLVIVGAGRSGTNMLRDILGSLPGFSTWPCDEINYIWRHGSRAWPDDALPAERATESFQRFLDRRFAAQWKRGGQAIVVEKTCANSLRLPYVDRALRGRARYLHIVRDGRDVTASAEKRWTASLDLRYVLKKARFVPPSDLPYYAFRYLGARLHRLRSSDRRLGSWGPRYPGMTEDLAQLALGEVIAKQWDACVRSSRDALAALPAERCLTLRYENFTADPATGMQRIGDFLAQSWSAEQCAHATTQVSDRSVGGWRKKLDPELAARIEQLFGATLTWVEQAEA